WFGFTGGASSTSTTTTTTTPPTTSTTTSSGGSSTSTGVAEHWGQCGGNGWTGPTACASGYTCTVIN
ncbi:hypothetical protein KXW27_000358, partial [Aspergillus fumigatus]